MKELMHSRKTFTMPSGNELSEMVNLCKLLFEAPYYKKMTPGGILAILLTAKEMGLPQMGCLNGGMHVIEGKVSLSSHMMNLMIINAGHFAEPLHRGADYCEIEFERSDRQGRRSKYIHRYTMEDAKTAKLTTKDNWIKNPKAMLYARCLSEGGKIWMPDVFMGSYVTGELEVHAEEIEVQEVQEDAQKILLNEKNKHSQEITISVAPYEFAEEHMKYLDYVMSKSAWSVDQIKQWASNNPQDFERKYNKWLDELRTIEENEPPREES